MRNNDTGEVMDMSRNGRLRAVLALALVLLNFAAPATGTASARINTDVPGTQVPLIALHVPRTHPDGASASQASSDFHWGDAGIGAAVALVAFGLLLPVLTRASRNGREAHPA
jgi:hypothetical protein